ncbi:unnamed protein product [Rhodiola kirilowii]
MRNKCFNPAGWNRGILNKVAHRVGPKTLAQLQKKKKKAKQNGHPTEGNWSHTSSSKPVQFEGPKPLSEILKEKKKMNFGTE